MSFVVFLDVDGVLNTRTTCERAPSEQYTGIDELRIRILARAMRECGASGVVLTTTWKDLRPNHEDYIYLKDISDEDLYMQDYVINQLKESELRRKRGENKEIDLKEFIESRKNRIKELFPDINEVKTNAKDGNITRTK